VNNRIFSLLKLAKSFLFCITGMLYTGCYFNPVLASTIQFGCEGITLKDHVLVYWLGPIIGLFGFNMFSKLMESSSFDNNNKKIM
jgi:hypothetical protein